MTINGANNLIYGNYPNHLPDSIQELYLSHNRLQGTITTFPALLTYFEASGNLINGTFPDLPLRFLTARLDFNLLSGNLLITKASGLTILTASHNLLNGSICSIASLINLKILDLSFNLFNGSLPKLNTPIITSADLSHNQLSGEIDLGYSTINDLRLSFNKFDKFPKSLPKSINTLKLDNNGMQGNISYNLPTTLTTVDLSNNNLTGNIPNVLRNPNYANPSYLNISNNSFTGSIPKSLQYATTLDLSHNYLSGCINFQFNGSNFYFNDNYLSGNLSFLAPSQLYLQNNRLNDVLISNAIGLSNCSWQIIQWHQECLVKHFKINAI
eukprot:NODE_1139_length_2050_cov_0.317786.p1 type:complete len:327 gc:universal NODE_1139_length_2050_cov_0.317786:1832-852(-)